MADKETELSIVIRTVDKATAKIKEINDRLDAASKPLRGFKEALSELREKSGFDDVIGGVRGVGGALADVLGKVLMIGGLAAGAVTVLVSLVSSFDDLGDTAEALGVGVDFLAQTRFAAEKSGAEISALDGGMRNLATGLGMARAGSGKLAGFLKVVSPALLRQVKETKSNEEAFNLLADAAAKLTDKAKLAAFAQKTLGDASLGPLLAKGSKGIEELRNRYFELAGSQAAAADAAGPIDDSMKDLKATTDGLKAALVQGLSPALGQIVEELQAWFAENRERVAEWAAALGKKLPEAIHKFADAFFNAIDTVQGVIESIGGLKTVAIVLAGVIVGPLISSIVSLGIALATTPVGWIVTGIAAIAAGAYLLIKNWDSVAAFFATMWQSIKMAFWKYIEFFKSVFLNFSPIGLIIKYWEPISHFFVSLWGGITSTFDKAWEMIKVVVDKIIGAADRVNGAVGGAVSAFNFLNPISDDFLGSGPTVAASWSASAGAWAGAGAPKEARVTVDFANAPRGTRVTADPQNTATVDLSVGYQGVAL